MEQSTPNTCVIPDLNELPTLANESPTFSTPTKGTAEPAVGMEFTDSKDMFRFYNAYARNKGFGVSTVKSRTKDGVMCYKHLGCSRHGTSRKKEEADFHKDTGKIGCPAAIKGQVDKGTMKMTIIYVHLEHNHPLSRLAVAYLRSHRRICTPEKMEMVNMHAVGISTSQIVSTMARRKGSVRQLEFREKDCRNYLDRERHSQLAEGDAQVMVNHLRQLQVKFPNFIYVVDLNEIQQLRNVFWIHPRSRLACSYFGDVITFDTTYLTNTYRMPFAPFVGVNHHGQSTLLGCALLSNEKIETFEWVFDCWLQANNGVAPRAIITDQDKAMEAAVTSVFPNARHRFCLWHIMKKVPEKIGYICRANVGFVDVFDSCIYDSQTPHDFEEKWNCMMSQFPLCQENDWLKEIFDIRHKWVPVYVKDTFFAGMVKFSGVAPGEVPSEKENLTRTFSSLPAFPEHLWSIQCRHEIFIAHLLEKAPRS